MYHKHGKYGTERAEVLFILSSGMRFVQPVKNSPIINRGERSSWVYVDENTGSDEDINDDPSDLEQVTSDTRPSTSSRIRSAYKKPPCPSSSPTSNMRGDPLASPNRSKRTRSCPSRSAIFKHTQRKQSNLKASMLQDAHDADHHQRAVPTQSKLGSSSASEVLDDIEENTVSNRNSIISSQDRTDLNIRIELLERRFLEINKKDPSVMSSSAHSIIVSLRWNFLKVLEKPLKNVHIPGIAQNGLGFQQIITSVQCDYFTFREIAAALAKEHNCTSESLSKSRIAFSPSFNTTQSGSSASDNLNILFTCLADLTAFLRIRDDNDFETILSKEVVSDKITLLRILGTFTIQDQYGADINQYDKRKGKTSTVYSTDSTRSVSTTSHDSSKISLFIGTAPLDFKVCDASVAENLLENGDNQNRYRTIVIQQDCAHFCSTQKCYRTPWKPTPVTSPYSVSCIFDLDGTVSSDQLHKHFTLNWKKQSSPSNSKWTRDVHEIGNNPPGILTLSVPIMFFSAGRNVRSLVSILDNHIETFMNQRSYLHSLSSFK